MKSGPRPIFKAFFSQIGGYVFSKNDHMYIAIFGHFGPILANFDYFGLIFGREYQNWNFSDPLGLIGTMESKKLGPYDCL